jgi:hypothetical protein
MGPALGVINVGDVMIVGMPPWVKRMIAAADARLLARPIGLALEYQPVRGGLQPVDGGLGDNGSAINPSHFDRLAVGRHNCGRGPVALDDQLIDVRGVERVEGLEREVVDLSRHRDRSTYAGPATIEPPPVARTRWVGGRSGRPQGLASPSVFIPPASLAGLWGHLRARFSRRLGFMRLLRACRVNGHLVLPGRGQ